MSVRWRVCGRLAPGSIRGHLQHDLVVHRRANVALGAAAEHRGRRVSWREGRRVWAERRTGSWSGRLRTRQGRTEPVKRCAQEREGVRVWGCAVRAAVVAQEKS